MPGAQRQPNKWRFDSPHDGYLSEMVQNNNGIMGMLDKVTHS